MAKILKGIKSVEEPFMLDGVRCNHGEAHTEVRTKEMFHIYGK
jgi:hypothetical protein